MTKPRFVFQPSKGFYRLWPYIDRYCVNLLMIGPFASLDECWAVTTATPFGRI